MSKKKALGKLADAKDAQKSAQSTTAMSKTFKGFTDENEPQ